MKNETLGIMLDKNETSGIASRLTSISDPHHLVNTNITDEKHPVDAYSPWNGIEERGAINNKKVYYVPLFWFKIIEENRRMYIYISSTEREGFTKHPESGRVLYSGSMSFSEKHMAQLLYVMEFLDFKKLR